MKIIHNLEIKLFLNEMRPFRHGKQGSNDVLYFLLNKN